MTMWKKLMDRLTGRGTRRELDDEMAFHLEALTRDLMDRGMSPSEARREALRRFGNPEQIQERAREERGLALLDEAVRNIRFGLRGLRRDRVFSSVFILTLALTIGLGASAWAVGDAALWRALPFAEPERLLQVSLYNRAVGPESANSAADGVTWERIRDQGDPFELAVYSDWASGVNLTTDRAAAYVQQQRVGAGFFRVLGVPPARGREFLAAEDVPAGPAVVILAHRLWTDVFRGDPEILGSTIRLKGEPHTVVGIMPEGFRSPAGADLWTPLRPSTSGEGGGTNYTILARMPAGMLLSEARDRLAAVEPPEAWVNPEVEFRYGAVPLSESLSAGIRTPVLVLLGGVALMLLVGWANLMGLQLTRTMRRNRELATRSALGSGRGALVRQILTENVVVGLAGGVLGTALAVTARPWIQGLVENRLGTWQPLPGAGEMIPVAGALTLAAACVFGVAPVARAAVPGLASQVVSGARIQGRSRHWGRKAILVSQVALVTVLLFSAALLGRSYARLASLDPGFEPTGVMTLQYSLDDARFAEAEALRTLFRETVEDLEARQDVSSAAVALTLPYERPLNLVARHAGQEENLLTNVVYVTPGFFETVGIPLRRGRLLDGGDRPDTRVVMVANEAFVERYLESRDPLATELEMVGSLGLVPIVGVVGNVQQAAGFGGVSQPVWESPTLYVSAYQMPSGFMQAIHVWFSPSWVVRGRGAEAPPAPALHQAVTASVANLPLARAVSLSEVVDRTFSRQRFEAGLILIVTLFGLLLAGIGIYGVIGQEVEERRGEMGVRMAMGASPGGAVLTTAGGGLRIAGVGLVAGLALSVGASRFLESLVWGVPSWDVVSVAGVALVLGMAAAAASFLPASRIGRMDPARILRE
ncbi:MAG TPA: ABC transporter permease [Longimicrobiales bacterium]|nr:ABC transporter permease [Longimicrobiales bacterium]